MKLKEKKVFDPQKAELYEINIESNVQITHAFELGKCEMQVGFNTSVEYSDEANDLRILLDIILERNDDNDDFAEFNFEFYYKIQDLKDYHEVKKEIHILSAQVAVPLVGVSISTARGIIFERLHNTYWKNVLIPIVSPKVVLENSLKKH
ncbi:hypothetical protein H3Z85_07975 [Chryseobacterium indologenes]|uniref:hypothetical protein n=1 Tax=Chryseobacterium indologenes TaxID=253 RepID=UPI0003E07EA8|nr:hypothetical protein [Chryseobacterium indologenes]QPQ53275.1 hypothetical protein H3Z85_07975 [Chryseobacterium indologenes]GAE63571.1 hypothetical protein CIN01S_04_01770 [Chryseobacterium indologenes NBRC 14944]SFJ64527.1 hypothetical protein SAMN05421692_2238 [Chryseobacterium indologenes]SUX52097.1 Uncharacterised protein [Chryseobacterium indologenes]